MNYSKYSQYSATLVTNNYLDVLTSRNVPASPSDKRYTIDGKYHLRPDLLAHDLYGSVSLWWVFAERNPNALKDPLGDFRAGKIIYLPNASKLIKSLGI